MLRSLSFRSFYIKGAQKKKKKDQKHYSLITPSTVNHLVLRDSTVINATELPALLLSLGAPNSDRY